MHLPDMTRTFTEIRGVFGCKIFEKPDPVFAGKRLFIFKAVDELFHIFHKRDVSSFACVFSEAFVSVLSAAGSVVFA